MVRGNDESKPAFLASSAKGPKVSASVGASEEVPKDIWAGLRAIEIVSLRMADLALVGNYRSSFKGQGLAFREVRPYQAGDDIRTIDWNVSARFNETFVKVFSEERELSVMLLVDESPSTRFGTQRTSKSILACEVSALIAMSAIRHNDCVGLVLGGERVERLIAPRKGRKHALRIVTELFQRAHNDGAPLVPVSAKNSANAPPTAPLHVPLGARTDLAGLCDALRQVSRRRAVTFVVSDFFSEGYEQALGALVRKHDVVPVLLTDPRDLILPDIGLVSFEDMESGDVVMLDTADPLVRKHHQDQMHAFRSATTDSFRKLGLDHVSISTSGSCVDPLRQLFSRRTHRRRA
jgi:uncharacterized protein (DUF58 family)